MTARRRAEPEGDGREPAGGVKLTGLKAEAERCADLATTAPSAGYKAALRGAAYALRWAAGLEEEAPADRCIRLERPQSG